MSKRQTLGFCNMKDKFSNEIRLEKFPDNVRKVIEIIERLSNNNKVIPNFIFHGKTGRGKSAAAGFIAEMLDIEPFMSNLDNQSFSKKEWKNWLSTVESYSRLQSGLNIEDISSSGKYNLAIIEEIDKLPENGKELRSIIETDCIFIFTTNDISRLDESFLSRTFCVHFDGSDLRQEAILQSMSA